MISTTFCQSMSCASSFFFFKQKTAYEMRISDWSSDVCSSDLGEIAGERQSRLLAEAVAAQRVLFGQRRHDRLGPRILPDDGVMDRPAGRAVPQHAGLALVGDSDRRQPVAADPRAGKRDMHAVRSEEHTSELQSLMRNSYAVFCLK